MLHVSQRGCAFLADNHVPRRRIFRKRRQIVTWACHCQVDLACCELEFQSPSRMTTTIGSERPKRPPQQSLELKAGCVHACALCQSIAPGGGVLGASRTAGGQRVGCDRDAVSATGRDGASQIARGAQFVYFSPHHRSTPSHDQDLLPSVVGTRGTHA